jgi:phage terminase small subunit
VLDSSRLSAAWDGAIRSRRIWRTCSRGAVEARRNPFDIIRERTAASCARLLAEFGLTPSSRTRLSVQPKQEERVRARSRA